MRTTYISVLLLLASTACASDGNRSATAAPTVGVAQDAPNAAEPQRGQTVSPAPKATGLTLSLHGRNNYTLDTMRPPIGSQSSGLTNPIARDYLPPGFSPPPQAGRAAQLGTPVVVQHVAAARVSLVLRITNPTSSPIHFKTSGDSTSRRLAMTTVAGAENPSFMFYGGDTTEIYMCGAWQTLAAGAHLDIPMNELRYGNRAHDLGATWTAAGTYRLVVGMDTVVMSEAMPNGCSGGKRTQLVSPPMTIDVR